MHKQQQQQQHVKLLETEKKQNYHSLTQSCIGNYDGLNYEKNRLLTFIDWPVPDNVVSVTDLARDGFYYLRKRDHVLCFSCHTLIGSWEFGDNVRIEHEKFSPKCGFVKNNPIGNITLEQSNILDQFYQKKKEENDQQQQHLKKKDDNLYKCLYYQFSDVEDRRATFNQWPETMTKKSPNEMASAGFFYRGQSDHVECFFCGVRIRNWRESDDVWVQHVLHSKSSSSYSFSCCLYVEICKGKKFIKKTIAKAKLKSNSSSSSCTIITTTKTSFDEIPDATLNFLLNSFDITRCLLSQYTFRYSYDVCKYILKQRLVKTGLPYFSIFTCIEDLNKFKKNNQILFLKEEEEEKKIGSKSNSINESSSSSSNEKRICQICKTNSTTICFWPCRHFQCCSNCALLSAYCYINGDNYYSQQPSRDNKYYSGHTCPICHIPTELIFKVEYKSLCQNCFKRKSNICFLPCAHLQVCDECAVIYTPDFEFPIKCLICKEDSQYNFLVK